MCVRVCVLNYAVNMLHYIISGEYDKVRNEPTPEEFAASLLNWDKGIYRIWSILSSTPGVGYIPEVNSSQQGLIRVCIYSD